MVTAHNVNWVRRVYERHPTDLAEELEMTAQDIANMSLEEAKRMVIWTRWAKALYPNEPDTNQARMDVEQEWVQIDAVNIAWAELCRQ